MADAKLLWIGKYRDFELLGEGAMGVVYKAVDSVLGRTVAIKVMSDSIAQHEVLRQRFVREAQAAASLQHQNVVCIHDFGDVDGHLFIVMEFIDGTDLERLIDRGELHSVQAKLDVIIDVLHGLAFAHQRGVVHRDIKPANIRIDAEGRAKIMDFGVAHLVSSHMTSTGAVLGTPSYMAPEQITEGKTSPATDIFAVGVVLYQLLSSTRPFDGSNLPNLLFQIVTEDPRPIRDLVPGVPRELDRIVMRSMAKEPAMRYANAGDMANDLAAVRATLGASSPADPASTGAARVGMSIRSNGRFTQVRALAYLGAGVVAAAALAAIVLSRLPQAPRPVSATVQDASSKALLLPSPASASHTVGRQREPSPVTRRPKPEANPAASGRDAAAQQQLPVTAMALTPQTVAVPEQRDTTLPPPPAPAGADITPALEAYARAIESRNIGDIRSVEPGLTPEQQRSFEQFFQAAHDITVTFRVADIKSSERAATARVIGRYDYLNANGQKERQPVSVSATFRHDGKVWRLVAIQ